MTQIDAELAGNGWFDKAVYQTIRGITFGFCRVWCRATVEGRENIPKTGTFLLTPVHRSIIDTPITSGVTYRRMRFMGADKYWKNKYFGRVLTACGGFPVTRGSADREALKRCIDILAGGEPLVLFPEGERKSGPLVQPLFAGATYIAVKAGVPIVPMAIAGSDRAMPKGAKFIYPRKVHVVVGKPMPIPSLDGERTQRIVVRELSAQLHTEMQRLLDQANARIA